MISEIRAKHESFSFSVMPAPAIFLLLVFRSVAMTTQDNYSCLSSSIFTAEHVGEITPSRDRITIYLLDLML